MKPSAYFDKQKDAAIARQRGPQIKLWTMDIECAPAADSFERFEPDIKPEEVEQPRIARNLRDPAKIAAANEELVERMEQWHRKREESLAQKRDAWFREGALKAERGQILAFGYRGIDWRPGHVQILHGEDEEEIILGYLKELKQAINEGYTVAGFNILDYDLPYLRRRCIVLGIPFTDFFDRNEKWKPWRFPTYDAMKDWQSGAYGSKFASVDDLARGFGVGKKTGDGAKFAELYRSDKPAALAYLTNDVLIEEPICLRMLGIGNSVSETLL